MSTSDIVEATLDGEPVAARVDLGGEDELLVTPTRTLVYRAEGLLSDESVEEFPHGAERVSVSQSRRKAKVTLDYGLDGEETFALPSNRLEEALHPVLAGVLNAADITGPGETVKQTFRFSELTLVVTSARVVKHIGTAVWDDEYEEYHYDDVTDLTFEEGSVATSVVITMGDRQERFKAPNDDARRVSESLEDALLGYYDVASLEEFRTAVAPDVDEGAPDADADGVAFGDGPDPLSVNPAELAEEPANGTRNADDRDDAEESSTVAEAVAESLERPPADEGASVVEAAVPATADDAAEADTHAPVADAVAEAEADAESTEGERAAEADAPAAAAADRDADGPDGVDAGSAGVRSADGVDDGFEGSGFQSAATLDEADVAAELADLRAAVEAQNERLDRQHDLIEQLVRELRRGR